MKISVFFVFLFNLFVSGCTAVGKPVSSITTPIKNSNDDSIILQRFNYIVGDTPLGGREVLICGEYINTLESQHNQGGFQYGMNSEVRVNGILMDYVTSLKNVKILSSEANGCKFSEQGVLKILLTAQLDGYKQTKELSNSGWDSYRNQEHTYRSYSGSLESWQTLDVAHFAFDALDISSKRIIASTDLTQFLASENKAKSFMAFGRLFGVYYINSKTSNSDFFEAKSSALERGLLVMLMDVLGVSKRKQEFVITGFYVENEGPYIAADYSGAENTSILSYDIDVHLKSGVVQNVSSPFNNGILILRDVSKDFGELDMSLVEKLVIRIKRLDNEIYEKEFNYDMF